MTLRTTIAACLCLVAVATTANAAPKAGKGDDQSHGAGILSLLPETATTTHSITVDGKTLDYTARAGTLSLIGADASVLAKMFYVAYTRGGKDATASPGRPVTFVFNGGPGAASAYLQLGALGPRILKTAPDGRFLPPPQKLADNPDTWLDMTDLVFVDPVGTGYSRAGPGQKDSSFWGIRQDASAMASFIRLYLQQAGRTASPVYLAGESYGGFRAALLADTLQQKTGIAPSGIVLISPALEFSFVYGDETKPLHWALPLPSMAAVNFERQGLEGQALEDRLKPVEHYALNGYLTALAAGLESGGETASTEVARDTGLPLDIVRKHNARIAPSTFARDFDRASGHVLSLYDGTIETADIAPASNRNQTPDPVLDRSIPVVTSAFVDYVRNVLNYRTVVSYRLLNGEIARKWDYGTGHSRQGYAGVLDNLQDARALNPDLKVLIVHGRTDLVTPYMISRYLVSQLPRLPDTEPIRLETYPGGHMMYLRPDSRHRLKEDAARLYGNPS